MFVLAHPLTGSQLRLAVLIPTSLGRQVRCGAMATKSVPCKFHQKGLCRNGSGCPFSHSGSSVQRPEAATKIRTFALTNASQRMSTPCHFFLEGRCMKGDKCPHRHEGPEQPVGDSGRCLFFLQGNCSFGNTCRRSHSLGPDGVLPANPMLPRGTASNMNTETVLVHIRDISNDNLERPQWKS